MHPELQFPNYRSSAFFKRQKGGTKGVIFIPTDDISEQSSNSTTSSKGHIPSSNSHKIVAQTGYKCHWLCYLTVTHSGEGD